MSKPKKIYSSSSEEEDDGDNYIPRSTYHKSAVFNFKVGSTPIIEHHDEQLDVSKSQGEQDGSHLKPKLSPQKQAASIRTSNLYLKNAVSQNKLTQKEVIAAYTFKLKSPVLGKKKKSDPVSLFQQTSSAWKKDRFLTSRGNNKEGRKLELDKRNKQFNT